MNTPGITPTGFEATLRFACHPGVACFNECCRDLDLELSPWDVLRLRRGLGLSTGAFLRRHTQTSREEGRIFPICRLRMADDERASCPFVRPEGCSVYADRPAACRTYPLARGARLLPEGRVEEHLALVREEHCLGFAEDRTQSVAAWLAEQGLDAYNRAGDALLRLHQHPRVRDGSFQPTDQQLHHYMLALFDQDRFRELLAKGVIKLPFPLTPAQRRALANPEQADADLVLLLLAVDRLVRDFFG